MIKCYHISPIKNRQSILEKGLLPGSNKLIKYSKRLFFSTDIKILGFDYVDYSHVDVWSFFLPESKIKTDKKAWHKCFGYTTEKISSAKIKLEKTVL